jgi:glucoamylase
MWFTVGNGTLNELYFPDVDQANTRSVRFLVSDGESFFSDEQWDANHIVEWLAPGVPGCHIESKCKAGRYTIIKDIITDPVRDTLMMRVYFTTHQAEPALKLYLFQEPQMSDRGEDNTAWIGHYKAFPMMFAQRDRTSLATAFDPAALKMSCGYVGTSGGCKAPSSFETLSGATMAARGNVALTAEIDYRKNEGAFLLSLACGSDPAEAA